MKWLVAIATKLFTRNRRFKQGTAMFLSLAILSYLGLYDDRGWEMCYPELSSDLKASWAWCEPNSVQPRYESSLNGETPNEEETPKDQKATAL